MCNRIEDLIEKARHYEDLWHEALDENKRLKAEVERLTKELENTDCMFAMASAFAHDWNSMKEGKPSV